MSDFQIVQGDCLSVLRTLPENCMDSCVTDPPYGLSGKDPNLSEILSAWLSGESVKISGSGFMGKKWDAFVPGPEIWREVYRVLKPGAHLAAFAGSRTFDLMALSIRLAGFQLRDSVSLVGWLFGSGFPKSLDLGGGRGTALKPAFEPVLLFRKPPEGTLTKNLEKHGTGGLNIDACRIPTNDDTRRNSSGVNNGFLGTSTFKIRERRFNEKEKTGRWPANLCLVHHPDCVEGSCVPECVTKELDEQSDRASRFFTQFYYAPKASRKEREAGCESLPAKTGAQAVGRQEDSAGVNNPRAGAGRTAREVRNTHPTVKPLSVMRWLVKLLTPANGVVLDPFAGSGSTVVAALLEGFDALGIELEEESAKIAGARASYWQKVA